MSLVKALQSKLQIHENIGFKPLACLTFPTQNADSGEVPYTLLGAANKMKSEGHDTH